MQLVLWDIDGTLVDTAGHGRNAFDEAFESVFGRRPESGGVQMAGRTDHAITLALLEHNGVAEGGAHVPRMLDALAGALAERQELIREEGHAQPGAHEALVALGAREEVLQSLLTGNIEANAAVKLAAFGLESLVDLEIGGYGSDTSVRSELVAIARERAEAKHGVIVHPEDTVLIGDTPLDVEAAHAAGARAVAVATGPHGVEELRASGAEAVLADLSDTAALLGALDLA